MPDRIERMDRVRFGRALGKGARLAVRTAMEAADAATAVAPPASARRSGAPAVPPGPMPRQDRRSPPVILAPAALGNAVKAARTGFTAPLRQASSALWNELTGSFFALFAVSFAVGAWHTRTAFHSRVPADRYRLAGFCLLTLLFAYFSVSNFLRARLRSTR